MMCDMLCSSELSHHNLSHNLPSARSIGDKTSTGVYPVLHKRTEAKPQNNRNKTNVLPKPVKATPKVTAGSDWILHTSFTASWSPPHLIAGKRDWELHPKLKCLDSSERYLPPLLLYYKGQNPWTLSPQTTQPLRIYYRKCILESDPSMAQNLSSLCSWMLQGWIWAGGGGRVLWASWLYYFL